MKLGSGSSIEEQQAALAALLQHDEAIEHTLTPLWRESRCMLEWGYLRMSPLYYGVGVPRGHGQPVLVIPGFMAGDMMMLEMHRWLRRIGYRSSLSRISWNNDCPDRTRLQLIHRTRELADKTGDKVNLIGHSLGGMLAKGVAQSIPECVDRVVTLGSPFRSLVKAHPAVVGLWDQLKIAQGQLIGRNLKATCGSGHCTCDFVRGISQPRRVDVPQFAVYSKKDGVADWSSCVEDDDACNTEVTCSHMGMACDIGTYRAIAMRLSQSIAAD